MSAADKVRKHKNPRFPLAKARTALRVVREAYGDDARVTVNPDGSVTVERIEPEKPKKATKPEKDFVL